MKASFLHLRDLGSAEPVDWRASDKPHAAAGKPQASAKAAAPVKAKASPKTPASATVKAKAAAKVPAKPTVSKKTAEVSVTPAPTVSTPTKVTPAPKPSTSPAVAAATEAPVAVSSG